MQIICHSGGARGSDTYWEEIGKKYNVITKAYSYKTSSHNSPSKIEISDTDYNEGINEIKLANKFLLRPGIHKYMNYLSRNWSQVKYSKQTFGIGYIVNPGSKSPKGYYSKSKYQTVDGGTGYAVQMSINHNRDVYIFDQLKECWFRWSYITNSFIKIDIPVIETTDFAGIGTREITHIGIQAIEDVYNKTFH